jgi:hypothetical protein
MDKQIFELNRNMAEIPTLLESLHKEFEDKKTAYKSVEENKQKMQLRQKEREGELAAKEEGIKKSQGQLGVLKTNKEYQAKLAEIESLKADKSLIEEDILKLMDEIEQAKSAVENEKKALGGEEKIYGDKKRVLEEKAQEIKASLQTLEGKRSIVAAGVDKKILQTYEHILHGCDGLALVGAGNNSCEGCHMRVPHQVVHEIKMYTRLIMCENCARIMYLQDDVQP